MALKIITFIFVASLAFGIQNQTDVKDVPFDVNEIIHQITPRNYKQSKNQTQISSCPTGEFLIDTSIVCVAAPGDQGIPAIAFDGTNYLIAWKDNRSGNNDIYGTRMSQDGNVIDQACIPISTAINDQWNPTIAFDGTNYMVAWVDFRNGHYSDIYGSRVSQSGVVLDPNGFVISSDTGRQESPAIVFGGTNYFVVWQDGLTGSPYNIYGSRVSQSGTVIDTEGIAISTAINTQFLPGLAFDGTNYLIVWQDRRNGSDDIYGARVSQSGAVLDTAGIAISTATGNQWEPSVAFDGTNYLVVWSDDSSGYYEFDIYGTRVSQNGAILDPNGIPISTAVNQQVGTALSFDGTNYLVVWEDGRNSSPFDIYGGRISRSGTMLDTNGFAISTAVNYQEFPAIAFDGINYLAVWLDRRYGYDIYGTCISQTGVVFDTSGIIISTAVHNQEYSSSAFDGTNYLVAWQDYRNGYYSDIYGARLSITGTVFDPSGFIISTAINDQRTPVCVFDGRNYLVVWSDTRNETAPHYYTDIYGARVSQSGAILDPDGIAISTASDFQEKPAIAFDGINYLVIWEDQRSSNSRDIYGTRVSQDGTVLDPIGIPISTAANFQQFPDLAFDGTNYLVVWQDGRNSSPYNIYGARVSQSGTILDTEGIPISTAANWQTYPSIAFDGTNYLVVWQNALTGFPYDIHGARVSQNGTVLDTVDIVISAATNDQRSPVIAYDGTNYLVAWQDERNYPDTVDIYGAQISPSGTLIDSFAVSTQEGHQNSPTLIHGPSYQILITYHGWVREYQGRIYNTTRIWGKFYPFVGIAEENSKVKMQSAKLFEVYPNPAKGVVRVRGPLNEKTIKIFDICGKMIKEIATTASQSRNDGAVVISLKGINPGIYFLQLGTEIRKFLVIR